MAHRADTHTTDQPTRPTRPAGSLLWLLLPLAAWLLVAGPVLQKELRLGDAYRLPDGRYVSSEQGDQEKYHQPVIDRFEQEWPQPNIRDYKSATGPGYHLLMAGVHAITSDWRGPKIANALIGALMIAALWYALLPAAGPRTAALLALPLACSSYTASSSIWLTTDNLAWLGVILTLALTVMRPYHPARTITAGFVSAACVFVRQIHIWTLAPVGFAGLLASPLALLLPRIMQRESKRRWSALLIGIIAAALPAALLAYLAWIWGGLTPPEYRDLHAAHPNPATPGFALLCCAVLGVWFLPAAWTQLRALRPTDPALWICIILALITALAVPTDFAPKERAFGWIWEIIVKQGRDISGRSIAMAIGAPIGALVLLLLYRRARDAARAPTALFLLLTLAGWTCAQSLNTMAWQRYFEPIILAALAMLCALGGPLRTRTAVGAILALAIALGAITTLTITR